MNSQFKLHGYFIYILLSSAWRQGIYMLSQTQTHQISCWSSPPSSSCCGKKRNPFQNFLLSDFPFFFHTVHPRPENTRQAQGVFRSSNVLMSPAAWFPFDGRGQVGDKDRGYDGEEEDKGDAQVFCTNKRFGRESTRHAFGGHSAHSSVYTRTWYHTNRLQFLRSRIAV